MGYGLGGQLEPDLWKELVWDSKKPWRMQRSIPEYKRFSGWEY